MRLGLAPMGFAVSLNGGHYHGLFMLLFIGVWHFIYVQLDAMLYAVFQATRLPYVMALWRNDFHNQEPPPCLN